MNSNAKSSYRFEVPKTIESFKLSGDVAGTTTHRYYYDDPSFNFYITLITEKKGNKEEISLYAHSTKNYMFLAQYYFVILDSRSFKRGCKEFFKKINNVLLSVTSE